jgi:hypothetical protein
MLQRVHARSPLTTAISSTLSAMCVLTAEVSAQVSVPATADAEIREAQPERTRGFGGPVAWPASAGTDQQGQLQISATANNRNLQLLRFHIPNQFNNAADFQGFAAMRIVSRANFNVGAGGSSLRLYGIAPTNPLGPLWDEQNVMYRDGGKHQVVVPEIGNNQTETPTPPNNPYFNGTLGTGEALVIRQWGTNADYPMPTLTDLNGQAPPIPATGSAGYGANSAHARRAPGLTYENAPFSQQVATENSARLTYNQNIFTNYQADIGDGTLDGTYAYLPYVNQPAYGVAANATASLPSAISIGDGDPTTTNDGFTDIWSDIPETNRPWFSGPTDSWLDDLDASAQFIGMLTMHNASFLPAGGEFVEFGSPGGKVSTTTAIWQETNANLIAFLASCLSVGQRDVTFIVGPGVGQPTPLAGNPSDINNTVNQQWASKDVIYNGQLGALSPLLILTPEPTAVTALLAIGAMFLGRGSRRRTSG